MIPPLVRPFTVTGSGREALARILTYLQLRPADEVWLSTTMGLRDLQVSPCVTATIARHCRFAFQPGPRTAAALVIHDFGVPHRDLAAIRARCDYHGWPLIEDAAHAFASTDAAGRRMGTVADFALFSLPKFFAVPNGGLVIGLPAQAAGPEDGTAAERFRAVLPATADIAETRRRNWQSLHRLLGPHGLDSDLPLTRGSVPACYLLRTAHQFATLRRLRRAGIESGPEIHCDRVFLPCHQHLDLDDIGRIVALVASGSAEASPSSNPTMPGRPLRLTPQRVD